MLAVCLLSFLLPGTASAEKEKPAASHEEAKQEATAPEVVEKPDGKAETQSQPTAKEGNPAAKKASETVALKTPEKESADAVDPDDVIAAETQDAQVAAVAKPVSADPIQIYGWRENIFIKGVADKVQAKLDTGALTSSIHAEDMELFERDGKKWVRFIVTDPSVKKPTRTRIEAPLVRIARIKEPGAESIAREVVKLSFTIGERKVRGEFTLNNRSNMLAPVLIGRSLIKDLGWVDASRTYLADQKIFR